MPQRPLPATKLLFSRRYGRNSNGENRAFEKKPRALEKYENDKQMFHPWHTASTDIKPTVRPESAREARVALAFASPDTLFRKIFWIRAWVSMTLSSGNWRIVQIKRDPGRDHFVKEPNAAAECCTNNATCLSKYTSAVKYLNIRMRMYTRPSVMICIINSTYTLAHTHRRTGAYRHSGIRRQISDEQTRWLYK